MECVCLELDANRAFLTHLPTEPSLPRCPVNPEHYPSLNVVGPSEKGERRDGIEFPAPGEIGLSLYGQFLKGVLVHPDPPLAGPARDTSVPAPPRRHSARRLDALIRNFIAETGGEPTYKQSKTWAHEHDLPRDLVWQKVKEQIGPRPKGRRYKASTP